MDKPTIRILQRPCQPSDNQSSQNSKPPTVLKTLEQREADYAAARRRIMESEDSQQEGNDSSILTGNSKMAADSANGDSPSRQLPTSTVTAVSATPLMSIPATAATVSTLYPELGLSNVTPSWNKSGGAVQRSMTHGGNARQGYAVVNVAQKLQQQQTTSTTNVTRSTMQQQPNRLLTASASSPSFFNSRTTSQPVPLFPSHTNAAANTGLLPTPPGFNYSMQNATLNNNGNGSIGIHHSHSAAYALMQQFGLFQQQYQQALNGFQNHSSLSSTIPHSGVSFNPFAFSSVASQSNSTQKYSHPSTFN